MTSASSVGARNLPHTAGRHHRLEMRTVTLYAMKEGELASKRKCHRSLLTKQKEGWGRCRVTAPFPENPYKLDENSI